jgi:hypothetical protein
VIVIHTIVFEGRQGPTLSQLRTTLEEFVTKFPNTDETAQVEARTRPDGSLIALTVRETNE